MRDNRANQNMDREMKPASLNGTTSTNEQLIPNVSEKGYVFLLLPSRVFMECAYVVFIICL